MQSIGPADQPPIDPIMVQRLRVSWGYFDTLRIAQLAGRTFTPLNRRKRSFHIR